MKISKSHYDRLYQRRLWLTNRIEAKEKTGWETQYDESERDALAAALAVLEVDITPDPGEGWRIAEGDDWKDVRCERWSENHRAWVRRAVAATGIPFNPVDHYRIPVDPAPTYPPVPEGWRELGGDEEIKEGDRYCFTSEWKEVCNNIGSLRGRFDYPHIRRIEPTYRPFASAEEFDAESHRIVVNIGTGTRRRIDHYSDKGCMGMSWEMAHRKWRFLDDGSPFGVEVKP